jgi:hypothetical protein
MISSSIYAIHGTSELRIDHPNGDARYSCQVEHVVTTPRLQKLSPPIKGNHPQIYPDYLPVNSDSYGTCRFFRYVGVP